MRRVLMALGLLLLLVSIAGLAWAQSGYHLGWWTVDGGGGRLASDGGYTLLGTAGQPDAGPSLASDSYTLTGGFSSGAPAVSPAGDHRVFLPIVVR